MARVTDELLPHENDGIQEFDNPLPVWWLMLFYGSILWTVAYVSYYHWITDWSSIQQYEDELAIADARMARVQATAPTVSAAEAVGDAQRVERGKELFASRCASCHAADATGRIGPDLTDEEWIHGGRPDDILRTITDGVPAKGMITWKGQLSPSALLDATAFVASLGGAELGDDDEVEDVVPDKEEEESDDALHGAESEPEHD